MLGDQGARGDFANVAHEVVEQGVLLGREFDAFAAAADSPAHRIDFQIGEPKNLIGLQRAAAQQGADARKQFRKRERLDEVVVGPEFQPFDPVGYIVACA